MREPWDLAQGFIDNLNRQAAQSRATGDNVLMRMIDQQVARQNAGIAQGYTMDRMAKQNEYGTIADTTAFDRQIQRDDTAYGRQGERDVQQRRWEQEDQTLDQGNRQSNLILEQRLQAEREAARGEYPGTIVSSLSQTESGGNFGAQNDAVGSGGRRGHFGRLQFGQARLDEAKAAGVIPADMTPEQFMADERAQMRTEAWHVNDIDHDAKQRGLDRYIGQTIGGVLITPEAIQAMAHLGGIGGAEKFIKTGGQYNPSDVNGTSLRDYAITHGNAGNSPQRRHSNPVQQQSVSTEILGLPVASTAGHRAAPEIPGWQTAWLADQGMQVMGTTQMTGAEVEMLPAELKEMLIPLMSDGLRDPRERATYIRVKPIARDRNQPQVDAPTELPNRKTAGEIDGVDLIVPD